MPGRKQNQAKQNKQSNGFNPDAPGIQKYPTDEEFEAAKTGVCLSIALVKPYPIMVDIEAKKFIITHLQCATEYEGWTGRISFAWGAPADETALPDKVCSITDRKEYDDGFIITIYSKLALREETIANMKIFEGVMREKFGDNFRVEVCGSLPCCDCGKCNHIEYCLNFTNVELGELCSDHQALKLQTNEQADVITRQMAEIAELKAEIVELKAEIVELKAENENFQSQIDEGELVLSDDVVCSCHDNMNDYIWGRVKDICREENLPYPYFNEVAITNELQSALVLKGENEKLKKEIEELKAIQVCADKPEE